MGRLAEGRLHMSKWTLAALSIHAATIFMEIAPGTTSDVGVCNVSTGDAVSRYGDVSQGAAFPCRCEGGSCHPENGTCLEGSQCIRTQPQTYRWQGDGCRIGNVALNKPAYQLGQWKDRVPGLAVDGGTSGAGIRCAYPAGGPGAAWWYVDLEEVYEIHRVVVYNTNGKFYSRMRNFVIVVGNSTNMTENAICAEYNGTVPRGGQADLRCDEPLYGRYAGFLSRRTDQGRHAVLICEVVAMGRSLVDCSSCPDCCDDYNGCRICPNGTRLPDCVRECSGNHDYGENCESRCSDHCAESAGRVCDAYNGTCLWGCNITDFHNGDSWVGDRCDVIVPSVAIDALTIPSTTIAIVSVLVVVMVGSLIGLVICFQVRRRRRRTGRIPPPHRDAVGADHQGQNEADTAESEADGYQSLAAADPQGPAPYSQLLKRQETEDSYTEIGDLSAGAGDVNEYEEVTGNEANLCKEGVIYQNV